MLLHLQNLNDYLHRGYVWWRSDFSQRASVDHTSGSGSLVSVLFMMIITGAHTLQRFVLLTLCHTCAHVHAFQTCRSRDLSRFLLRVSNSGSVTFWLHLLTSSSQRWTSSFNSRSALLVRQIIILCLCMNCDSCAYSSMCIVSESCGKSGQSQERDNVLQFVGQTESLMHVFFVLCRLQQKRKWNIEHKAGSQSTNIILTQI